MSCLGANLFLNCNAQIALTLNSKQFTSKYDLKFGLRSLNNYMQALKLLRQIFSADQYRRAKFVLC